MMFPLLFSIFTLLHFPAAVSLHIHISNVKSASAPLRVALYNNSKRFPDANGYVLAKSFIPGSTGVATIVFSNIEEGDYAVAIYQDLDNNSKLNSNLFGYPKEPFCFSNNIRPRFSAPSFKQCRVTVSAASRDIFVKLID